MWALNDHVLRYGLRPANSHAIDLSHTQETAVSSPIPNLDFDPYADDVVVDPYDHYQVMRDIGPVFRLTAHDVLGVARYDDVKAAMKEHTVFRSHMGPALNEPHNQKMRQGVVSAEPPVHTEIRASMVKRLRLGSLRESRPIADALAKRYITDFLERGTFDAARELAHPFVASFVGELLGISRDLADFAIEASTAGFDATGPLNARTDAAEQVTGQLFNVMSALTKDDFTEGSICWDVMAAHERGELPAATSLGLIFNFLGPAFDTTINAIGSIVWLFANNPDQWQALRTEPQLMSSAIAEGLRVESPLQAWSRWVEDGAVVDGVEIPPQTRVAVFPGSANRDER